MRPHPRLARLALLSTLAAVALAGCVVGPRYRETPPSVPAALAGADPGHDAAPISRPVSRSADLADWWRGFGDPELDRLIDRALAANLDRQTAASRVRQARQSAAESRAGLFPTLDADSSATHTQISSNAGLSSLSSLFGGAGGGGSSGGSALATAGTPGLAFDTYDVGLSANFDLDLFGGRKRALQAANARAQEQVWNGRDTDVTVTSDVARAYLQLRADQARLSVIKASDKSQSDLLGLIGVRFKGGLITNVDVVQQRTQRASTQAQIAPLEASIDADVHQLGFLLAEPPQALGAELQAAADPVAALPAAPPEVPVGLPSDLLKRRPDIRSAERELAGTVADVGQATAALYPSVSLTGSFDFISSDVSTLLDAASHNYTYAAQLMAPLFDGGALRARRREAEERAIQAGVAYRRAALTALQQVADELSRYAADQRRILTLKAGYDDAQRAYRLTRTQYLGGLQDFQATLRAQANALQTQDQLVQTQAQLATDLVGLYRALGGGWDAARDVRRLPKPSPEWTGTAAQGR